MNIDQIVGTFVTEARELLESLEANLLTAESGTLDTETLNAIFRAAHTIKGSAGLFRLDSIVDFTHVVESVLDAVRAGRIELDSELVTLLLSCGDHIASLLDAVAAGNAACDAETLRQGSALRAKLSAYLEAPQASPVLPAASLSPAPVASAASTAPTSRAVSSDHWHISLRFGRDVLRHGMDPLSFIRYLTRLGDIVSIETVLDELPLADSLDAEACYLGFEIAFSSDASKQTIEDVFEFVRDSSSIRILPPKSRIAEYKLLIHELPEESSAPRQIGIGASTCLVSHNPSRSRTRKAWSKSRRTR